MSARLRLAGAAGLFGITLGSFFIGQRVEEAALAAKRQTADAQAALPAATATPPEPTYRELAVAEILSLPFPEFYEALRSAPKEAHDKWAAELENMPPLPQSVAATAAFYKLLVQFDPVGAANSACEIKAKGMQELALNSVVDAAPGFAMRDLAELFSKLPPDDSNYRKSLENVISEWAVIDPAAVAKFFDEHPDETDGISDDDLISNWAALDPEAARKWMDSHEFSPGITGAFFAGWYLNDREAALAYAVAHASDLAKTTALENLLSSLYVDPKEDAKKFVEQLPNDELRHGAFRALQFRVNFGTAEETGEPDLTPRAVADWMSQFPPAYWREHLSAVLGRWNTGPPQEVLSWIERLPAAIQGAVAAEYKKPTGKDTVETVSAVLQFARPDLRDQLLTAMFQNSIADTPQMKDEIKNSSMPAEQKRHLLEMAAKVERDEEAARDERERAETDQGNEK